MSYFNFEGFSDGEWDEKGDLSWNEHDWQQFLKRHEAEVARFLETYRSLEHDIDHLDQAAHQMGWDQDEWSGIDGEAEESERGDEGDDLDPYTLHRHPVFVVTRALARDLGTLFARWLRAYGEGLPPQRIWALGSHLRGLEVNAVLGVQALDMGDYGLSVNQMKLALIEINAILKMLVELSASHPKQTRLLANAARTRLFDIREVCLRVMLDCRDEMRRPS